MEAVGRPQRTQIRGLASLAKPMGATCGLGSRACSLRPCQSSAYGPWHVAPPMDTAHAPKSPVHGHRSTISAYPSNSPLASQLAWGCQLCAEVMTSWEHLAVMGETILCEHPRHLPCYIEEDLAQLTIRKRMFRWGLPVKLFLSFICVGCAKTAAVRRMLTQLPLSLLCFI